MNILYTITWPGSQSEEQPRQFFDQLRAGVARGARFPFDCPYEVAFVHVAAVPDAAPPLQDWAVAVLAMRVTTDIIGSTDNTLPVLENWFKECIPAGTPAGIAIESAEASHLKLASELRSKYDVVASFGTFVGEPELEAQPAVTTAPPPIPHKADAVNGLGGPPVSSQAQSILAGLPVATPPGAATPIRSDDSKTLSFCLGIGLLGGGVLLVPVSLLLAALMAFGQFSVDPQTGGATNTSTTDFVVLLACCPVPLLILGVVMILLGIYIPRWMKQNQAQPVTTMK